MDTDKLDSFTCQYIATALWSSVDDDDLPMDRGRDISDLAPEAVAKMAEDCRKFQESAGHLLDSDNLLRSSDDDWLGSFGHDFWLTRNGHGVGFWDGDYAQPAGELLTKLSKSFGQCDLYVGDDGLVYC